MVRIDMSEYMEKHSVSRLVGSPPGYIGYDEGGQLTEAVRRKPYCVLLLDEIEKAHPDVFNILLQILEDGRLTDAQGRTVDFRNAIVIMTSNVGRLRDREEHRHRVHGGRRDRPLVRRHEEPDHGRAEEGLPARVPQPHRRGHRLPQAHEGGDQEIVDLLLRRIRESLAERELSLNLSDDAADFLVDKGWDPAMGARPLRRAIQRYIEDPLADEVLSQTMPPGSTVEVDKAPDDDEDDVKISVVKPKERKRETVGVGAKGDAREEGCFRPTRRARTRRDLPDEPEVLPDVPDAPPPPQDKTDE